jgi:hypothetical protein
METLLPIHDTLDRGLAFVAAAQQTDGGFVSYSSPNPHDFSRAIAYRTTFATAVMLSALQEVHRPRAAAIRSAAAEFLLLRKSPDNWSWNYWASEGTEAASFSCPDDLDCTSCALTALWQHDTGLFDEQALAAIVGVFTACRVDEGGPYRTWLAPDGALAKWRDVDLAVNANVGSFLSLQGVDSPKVDRFIEAALRAGRIDSPYYPSPHPIMYFIGRFYRGRCRSEMLRWWRDPAVQAESRINALRTALGVSSQLRLGSPPAAVQSDVESILERQAPDGSWPACAFSIDPAIDKRVHYAGAPALTTALCLEAVGLFAGSHQAERPHQSPNLHKNGVFSLGMRAARLARPSTTRAGLSWRRMAGSIDASIDYLRRHLAPSGRFSYIFDAATSRVPDGYNLLRHAGTTMVLYRLVGTRFDDGSLSGEAERAWSYLTRFLASAQRGGIDCSCLVEAGVAKLGGTALALLALAAKIERSIFDRRDMDLLTKLACYLASQQEGDGRFISKSDLLTGREIPFRSLYYPGEAILALCAASRISGQVRFLECARRGARYLMGRDQEFPPGAIEFTDHWLMMALNALHAVDQDFAWVEHLRRLALPLVGDGAGANCRGAPPTPWLEVGTTTEIATRLEGLLGALDVELRLGERGRAMILLRGIFAGIARCIERQIGGDEMPRLDPKATGGFVQSPSQTSIRIDYVQHVLAATFGALELLVPAARLAAKKVGRSPMLDSELLLKHLAQISEEPDHALARYLFAAATSEVLSSGRVPLLPPRHFCLLATVELESFLAELAGVAEDEWDKNSRHKIRVQGETRSIELSGRAKNEVANRNNQYVRLRDASESFPRLMEWLRDFSSTVGNGTLQLARIVKLKARGRVYPHVDRGLYYLIRDRYHLVLKSRSGSRMQCEDQVSVWHPGQVWWFNNHVTHESFNDSDDERIHVIFDVLPRRSEMLVPYLQQYAATLEE